MSCSVGFVLLDSLPSKRRRTTAFGGPRLLVIGESVGLRGRVEGKVGASKDVSLVTFPWTEPFDAERFDAVLLASHAPHRTGVDQRPPRCCAKFH